MSENTSKRARSAGNRTPSLPSAMSDAAWKALGEMGAVRGAAENAFDHAYLEDGEYDGSDEPRKEAEREYAPHLYLDTTGAMGNPNRNRETAAYEAGHSMWSHYERVLSRGDDSTVNLLQEAARIGNRMNRDAALHRVGNVRVQDSTFREQMLDTGAARSGEQAADLAEEAASAAAARARNVTGGGDWTLIASTEAEARIARRVIDYALELMPADTALSSQKLIYNPAELPPKAQMLAVLNEVRPQLWRDMPDHVRFGTSEPAGKTAKAPVARKAVALIAGPGAETAVIGQLRQIDRNVAVIPGRSKALWAALIEAKDPHWRITAPFTQADASGKYPKNATFTDNEKVIDAADRVIVALNGRDDDPALAAAAYAARLGKLEAVLDAKGRQLDRAAASDQAMVANPSKAERARARSAPVFELPASSPEARFALTLVRPFRGPALSSAAIDAVAAVGEASGMSLREISEMARDRQGAQELLRTHKLAVGTIRVLADDKSMANAREAFQRIQTDCQKNGVTMVGRDHFPAGLAKDPNGPQVLFLQGGSPEKLAGAQNIVSFIGDTPALPHMTRRASELVVAMDRPEVTQLQVEDQGLPRFVPQNPGLLVLASGHAQFGPKASIAWSPVNEKGHEIGEGRTGKFALVPSKDGRTLNLMFLAKDADVSQTQTIKTTPVPPGGRPVDQPFPETDPAKAKAEAGRRAAWEEATEAMKGYAANHEQAILNKPTKDFRESFVAAGGMIVSALPPVEATSVYSTVTKTRESVPAIRTPESETRAIEIAARMSDVTVITQASTKGPMNTAVAAVAERGGKVVAVSPPTEIAAFDEVGGNVALARMAGRDLPDVMNIPGDRGLALRQTYGDRKVAVSTGQQMEAAAVKIVEALGVDTGRSRAVSAAEAYEVATPSSRKFEVESKAAGAAGKARARLNRKAGEDEAR